MDAQENLRRAAQNEATCIELNRVVKEQLTKIGELLHRNKILEVQVAQAKDEADFALIRLNHEADQKRHFQEVLQQVGDLAHDKSTGPVVPDVLWEIRQLAYNAFKENF